VDVGVVAAWIQFGVWTIGGVLGIRKLIARWKEGDKIETFSLSQGGIYVLLFIGLLVSSVSLYFNFRPRTVVQYVQQTQQPPTQRIIQGWGALDPSTCRANLSMEPLRPFAEKYDVVLICGLTDPKVDKFEDQRISSSPAYTIHPGTVDILFPSSAAMLDAVQKIKAETVKNLPTPPKKGVVLAIPVPMWYEVVLIVKGTNLGEIRKLSDIPRYGGKILSQEGF